MTGSEEIVCVEDMTGVEIAKMVRTTKPLRELPIGEGY